MVQRRSHQSKVREMANEERNAKKPRSAKAAGRNIRRSETSLVEILLEIPNPSAAIDD